MPRTWRGRPPLTARGAARRGWRTAAGTSPGPEVPPTRTVPGTVAWRAQPDPEEGLLLLLPWPDNDGAAAAAVVGPQRHHHHHHHQHQQSSPWPCETLVKGCLLSALLSPPSWTSLSLDEVVRATRLPLLVLLLEAAVLGLPCVPLCCCVSCGCLSAGRVAGTQPRTVGDASGKSEGLCSGWRRRAARERQSRLGTSCRRVSLVCTLALPSSSCACRTC